ncbi:uncharacterized protein LOC117339808 [Pecten maximus]|uniref:uncharacterized protein LOC117339808 n=1 Tax=Pecten maximus TaxID=6579 RepID=UPI00145858CF|nr:uncharacterized protein LOC117339808 [Pecten maximus]
MELRKGIRNTWGKDMPSNVRIVFLLGNTDEENHKRIREESEKYSDVIQEDFLDKYQNNTYKTIMGFNWGVTWPHYLAGGAYIVSFAVAQKFQIAFPYVKYLGKEDCFLGVVARKLNITLTHNLYFANRASFMNNNNIKQFDMFNLLGFKNPKKMRRLWDMLHVIDTTKTFAH